MVRKEFERRMRLLGWRRVGAIAGTPFVKWVHRTRDLSPIYAPNTDIINKHTAFKLLGEAER